jgi:hypothetical protein
VTGRAVVSVAAALATLAMGCSSEGSSSSSVRLGDTELVSAGALRVHWTHTGAAAALTVRRMTGLDAVPMSEPQCARDLAGRRPVYLDVNWRAVERGAVVPSAAISMSAHGSALTVVEPDGRCRPVENYRLEVLPGRAQRVLQLVGAEDPDLVLREIVVIVDGKRAALPLIPVCGTSGQPKSLSCTIDPVSYVGGAPFSADLQV